VADRKPLVKNLDAFAAKYGGNPPASNKAQHAAREAFDPLAEGLKGLVKQVDLLYKLSVRAGQLAIEIEGADLDRRKLGNSIKLLEEHRKVAVEQLKHAAYFHRQIAWLQDRFPQAEMQDVPGLCKVVTRKEIEKADWSLTPGRYVGVAPPEVDEDFDFEQAMRDIHVELADLHKEAAKLAVKIQANFEELGA
jgi:type I restriction enzyme M protein